MHTATETKNVQTVILQTESVTSKQTPTETGNTIED